MDIQHIREFVSLAETQNYFETASRLFVTTSSLSRHIKALEAEIGEPLFDRTTRRVSLTRYGHLLLPYAQDMIRINERWEAAFAQAQRGEEGRLTVGSIPMMKPYHITDLLAKFQRDNANVTITVKETDPLALVPMLRERVCDFAFLRDTDCHDDTLKMLPFAKDRLCVVVSKDHAFAGRDSVSAEMLKDQSLLLIGKDAFMYRLCTDMCRNAGFEPKVAFTSNRGDNLVDMVRQGLGIALLMRKAAASQIYRPGLRLVDVEPALTTTIYLAYSRGHKLSKSASSFFSLARTWVCEE